MATGMVSATLTLMIAVAMLSRCSDSSGETLRKAAADYAASHERLKAAQAFASGMAQDRVAQRDQRRTETPFNHFSSFEAKAKFVPADLCWQDYCPCDPPQGGPDAFLCRRFRAGLPVDEDQLSIAAGMRDVRKQIEECERNNPRDVEDRSDVHEAAGAGARGDRRAAGLEDFESAPREYPVSADPRSVHMTTPGGNL